MNITLNPRSEAILKKEITSGRFQSPEEVVEMAIESLGRAHHRDRDWSQRNPEMRWLAENRHRYVGQWVALEGSCLLASGATARDVFARVSDRPSPLVVRVDEDDLPFGGW